MAKNAQFSPELNYSFGAVMPETEFFIKTARDGFLPRPIIPLS